ncbi:restriction endonuclease subunit S [Streptosporangium sandarakinum]|uniref:restriction endonuclease subunit S n=1 Tax=Streptosporangium sandarakinum TaxID=1260955 RepID=UPI00379B0582
MTDLPPGWEWLPLREVGDWYGGGTPSKVKSEYWNNGAIPWLSPKDMGPEVLVDTKDQITNEAIEGSAVRLVPANSVAMVVRSGILERVFPVALVPFETTLNQDMRAVVPVAGIEPRWVAWGLRFLQSYVLRHCRKAGTTVASIEVPRLMEASLPVPPLAEQQRIIAALESHLSRLDAGLELTEKVKRRSLQLRSMVFDRAAQGLLICDENELDAVSAVAGLVGRSSKRVSYEGLPPLPVGWQWRVAEEVCSSIECGSTPRSDLMHEGCGDVPFIKVYNLTRSGSLDFSIRPTFIDRKTHEIQLKRSKIYPGDVLTNIVGPPLGKTAIVPSDYPEWNMNQAVVVFRSGHELLSDWLALALRSKFVMGRLEATARATAGQFNVALSACRELPIPVPPIDGQKRILNHARELLSVVDAAELAVASTESRAMSLRRALLEEAFSGRLVQQDRADEPASKLLARISAKRAAQPKLERARRTKPKESPAASRTEWPDASRTPTTYAQGELL